jgi:hypothetical protein
VPESLTFQTKQELALAMVMEAATFGHLRYRWLTSDEFFGRDGYFLDHVGAYAWYMAEIPTNTQVWLQRPHTEVPVWFGHGRMPLRVRLAKGELESQAVILMGLSSLEGA